MFYFLICFAVPENTPWLAGWVAGHGTHCAGMVGGAGIGIAGPAFGGVSILPCKFMDAEGSGATGDAIACLSWCIAQGARISSNRWELLCAPAHAALPAHHAMLFV